MFEAYVLKVLIATPGDTGEEVEAILKSLHGWNSRRAEAEGVILLPRHWKSDTVPLLHPDGGQAVINSQIVDDADIVIAVFDRRLGKATLGAVSGTAHEIERTSEAGKPVHVYFSDEPIDRKAIDLKELARLNEFRAEMEAKGLVAIYGDPIDLGHQVREAVEHDLVTMDLGVVQLRRPVGDEHAIPRGRRDGDKFIIENKSQSIAAEQFRFEVEGPCELLNYNGQPFDLPAQSEMSWGIAVFWSGPPQLTLTMHWLEDGEPREGSQIVAL
ncbi:MAG: hypothetical protein QOE48_6429 [Mycobacterium sp.]|jgi:hypothetical protein|nr:hypothetical protein [Mycobacterium sp.]